MGSQLRAIKDARLPGVWLHSIDILLEHLADPKVAEHYLANGSFASTGKYILGESILQ
jgi:hypothetical protein